MKGTEGERDRETETVGEMDRERDCGRGVPKKNLVKKITYKCKDLKRERLRKE